MDELLRATKFRVAIAASLVAFALAALNGLAAIGVMMVEFDQVPPPGWLSAWGVLPILLALMMGAATASWMGMTLMFKMSEAAQPEKP